MKSRVVDPAGVFFGLFVPILTAVGGLILAKVWEPRLPAQIATHWTTISPDGYSTPMASAWTFALVIALVGGGTCCFAVLAHAMLLMRRTLLIFGLTVVGMVSAVEVALLASQLDSVSGADTGLATWPMGLGGLVGYAMGLVGARMLRDYRVRVPAADRRPGPTGKSPVTDQVGFGTVGSVVLAIAVTLLALWVCQAADAWWPLAVVLPIGLLIVSLLRFRVVVDDAGIRVLNLGMTSISYGIEEIETVKVAEVAPFGDFDGWGLKVKGPRNYGVVTRTGPAVILTAACGDRLTVTSARAEEMAAILAPPAPAS